MRKKVIFLFFLAFLVFPRPALAQQGSTAVLPSGQTVNGDYFAGAGSVTLSGTVNGDAFLAGGNVIVDGTVSGDLLAVGGTVSISGRVANNIRVIGGQVIFTGEAGRNISIVAGAVNLGSSARVGSNLALAGGSLSVLLPVPGTINVAAGQITLGNTVGGDVNAVDMQLVLTSNAKIGGNLTYWSSSNAQIQSGAQVAGATTHNVTPVTPPSGQARRTAAAAIAGLIITLRFIDFVSAFIIGLLLLYFLPIDTREVVRLVREKPGMSAGVGILVFIVTPVVVAILLAIIITIPLALILGALYLIAVYLAKIFVFLLIGELIIPKAAKWLALLLGLVIYGLLLFIPFVGGLIMFLATIFGLGAIFLEKKDFYRELRAKNLI